jgi:hypothetical protein
MANTRIIVVPQEEVAVVSCSPSHSIKLNDEVPRGFDITKLIIEDFPEYLAKVHLHIGGNHAMTFDKEDILNKQNLFPQGFPLSLCEYMYVNVMFEYEAEYVDANVTTELVDEYVEEVEFSDTEEEYYDGCDYYFGRRVHRKQVPTGRQIKQICEGAPVVIPQLTIDIVETDKEQNTSLVLPVWDSITIDPSNPKFDERYIQRLIEGFKLHSRDGSDVMECYKNGKVVKCKLENFIRFCNSMAAKTHCF